MKILALILVLSVSSLEIVAQTNNSPYSALGIGDIEDSYFNRTSGMANTGIAFRSNRFLIGNNPASFSAQDNQFFGGETAVRGMLVTYYGPSVNPGSNKSSDITFRKIIFGIKPTKYWGTSVGLVPYSSQSYQFNNPQPILGTNGETSNAYYEGFGGLNKVYWANSYEFFHHLSLGVDFAYLFGSVQQKVILQDANQNELVSTLNNTSLNNFAVDFGVQYYTSITKKWDLSIGATFMPKTYLQAQNVVTVRGADSVELTTPIVNEYLYKLPLSVGAGIALSKNHKYTFLADYKYQNWSALNYSGFNYALRDSRYMSVGFEYSKHKTAYNLIYETMYLQAGLYYKNTYLNVYGQQINDMGVTAGIGINAKRSALGYSFVLQYGVRGTPDNQLIQERYTSLTFVLSYRDIWYTKGRKFN
ncbi:MAG TPA: hypothetical protein VMI35_00815 [Puia sp.]|nr:hypothetical protein [Puia sp.]